MANADTSPFVKHPALLALFAPRPTVPFKTPMPTKSMPKLTGVAKYVSMFTKDDNPPINKFETPKERKERLAREKAEKHKKVLAEREKHWDPHNNDNATKNPYKTLFVARLSYDLTEDDLRDDFSRFGRIRDVKLIVDSQTGKSRGYAFIEFERSNDLKDAFQHADGHKLKDRRILVDVERGRTVKTWKPRKLGGGLGKTRAGPSKDSKSSSLSAGGMRSSVRSGSLRDSPRHSRSDRDDRYSRHSRDERDDRFHRRRARYRDRDYRDRDRTSSRYDRDRKRSRSKSRDRKDRSRDGKRDRERDSRRSGKDRDRERDRDRDRGREKDRSDKRRDREKSGGAVAETKVRRSGEGRDRERSRRRRSRSKERVRR